MSLMCSISDAESNQLTMALIKAVNDAIASGKDEPDIVARLTENIPNQCKLVKKVGSYDVSVGGVFIHQTPKVHFEGMKKNNIELGDLLLISTVKKLSGDTKRKALLLQAKNITKLPVIDTGNDDQHKLYRDWPVFEYVRSSPALNGKTRCITGYDLYPAAKYLLFSKQLNPSGGWPHWIHSRVVHANALTAYPTDTLSSYECFVKELHDFVLSEKGKSFELLEYSEYTDLNELHETAIKCTPTVAKAFFLFIDDVNGWSLMINDLLRVTAEKTTRLMATAKGSTGKAARGVNLTEITALMTSDSTYRHFMNVERSDDLPPNNNEIDPSDDESEGGGISIIEFVLTESENPQEMRPDEQAE